MNSSWKFDKLEIERFHPHHMRKHHYRRCIAFLIIVGATAHHLAPQHEFWISVATNLVWLFDPTEV